MTYCRQGGTLLRYGCTLVPCEARTGPRRPAIALNARLFSRANKSTSSILDQSYSGMDGGHTRHAQLVPSSPAALQGRSAFRMIHHSGLCLDKGAQGIAYFYVPCREPSPPHVFHVFLSVPTVACQDLPVFAFSPYTQPRGSESWRGAHSRMWLAWRSASVMYQTRGQSCQGKHAFSQATTAAGFWSSAQVSLGGSLADLCSTAPSRMENVPQAHPERGFRTNLDGAGSLIQSGSKICYYT